MKIKPRPQKASLNQSEEYSFIRMNRPRFFVTTSRGFEDILNEELSEILAQYEIKGHVWNGSAGCYMESGWNACVAANLASMTASRVLLVLLECEVRNEEDLYRCASEIHWTEIFNLNQTFSINTSVANSFVNNSMFVSLKIKDAICDVFRNQVGERPNVNTEHSDIKIFARLVGKKLSISVDTTGEPLSLRGYRVKTGDAPLKESLAAALLRISGWNSLANQIWNNSEAVYFERKGTNENSGKKIPNQILLSPFFMDLMTGSGTLAIEAALAMLHWKPNAQREYFSFLSLCQNFSKEIKFAYRDLRAKIIANEKPLSDLPMRVKLYADKNGIDCVDKNFIPIRASDISRKSIELARECAQVAGVSRVIQFETRESSLCRPHASIGLQVVNPPYGERLHEDEDLTPLYKSLGDLWKQEFPHWTAWMLSSNENAIKAVGLRATRKVLVYNGSIQCKFLQYVLYPREKK